MSSIPKRERTEPFNNAVSAFGAERVKMAHSNVRNIGIVQSGPKPQTNTLG